MGAIMGAVLIWLRPGAIHGRTLRLFVTMESARDVRPGTEVWLAGQRVGLVDAVAFRSVDTDTAERVLLQLDVLREFQELMRHDSRVQLQAGGNLLGSPVVFLTVGSPDARTLQDGDTLRGLPQMDREALAAHLASAVDQFPLIWRDMREVHTDLVAGRGSIGAFAAPGGLAEVARVRSNVDRLGEVLARVRDPDAAFVEFRQRVDGALAHAQAIQAQVDGGSGTLGRLQQDSTLAREVRDARDELSILKFRLRSGDGAIGRLRTDGTLAARLADAQDALDRLLADMRKHPIRYINF
ncbi:MAG TPA: MlaD family protein [Gemmatimonadaceae bacterium]|nr:MlaD family protein [Gemmatimonadaceae bacterium]